MVKKLEGNLDHLRKVEILEAALHCFLKYGFAKTSMDDIARQANLSRPLIYLKFKSKNDLFLGVMTYLTEGTLERAAAVLAQKLSKRDKLLQIYEILLLEPWDKVVDHPMTAGFYQVCCDRWPEITNKQERQWGKILQTILGDREVTEVFMLAIEGLQSDLPPTKRLRRRIKLLCDHFCPP